MLSTITKIKFKQSSDYKRQWAEHLQETDSCVPEPPGIRKTEKTNGILKKGIV
jgi:hypothetical protein